MNLIIGSHVSFKSDKQLLGSVNEALSYGENTFMFYTGAPQNTMRSNINDNLTNKALEVMKENNINIDNVIVHAPYIVNLAKEDNDFAISFLKQEIKRCSMLHIKYMVLHPGSSVSITKEEGINKSLSIFDDTKKWLDIYFSGNEPSFTPEYKIDNTTDFRKDTISKMNQIPYRKVVSYGDIAREVAKKKGIKKMSAQAVGGAVGANPICIIIPCHRVIGTDGSLTGYGGGIKNKIELLKLEGYLKSE